LHPGLLHPLLPSAGRVYQLSAISGQLTGKKLDATLQAGLLALLTLASLPIPNRNSGVLPAKALTLFSQSQDYSGGTTPDSNRIPY